MKKSTDRNTILTTVRQRKFSKRARQYMLAYQAIELQTNKEILSKIDSKIKMIHSLLEKVVKVFKTHRNAAATNCKWISNVVGNMQNPIVINN